MNPSEYLRSISRTVVRQKFCLSRNDSGVWGDDFDDDGTIVLRSTEVAIDGGWRIDDPAVRKLTLTERRKGLLEAGDLVVTTSSGSRKHIGKTALVDESVAALGCAFANFMQRLRVKDGHDPRFFGYLLNAPVGREQMFYLGSTTTGLMNLNGTVIGDIEIPDTHPSTQQAIADFLDRKTAAIDALIEKKQKLLALLAEKRAALINQAVTKGLDQTVPMKDSGIPWIGEIPAHWVFLSVKRACRNVRDGTHAPPPRFPVGAHRLLSARNIQGGEFVLRDDDRRMTPKAFAELERSYTIRQGDLVLACVGATTGKSAVVGDVERVSVQRSLAILRPDADRIASRYLQMWIESEVVQHAIQLTTSQYAAQGGIYLEEVASLYLALPSLAEQGRILDEIGPRQSRIAALAGSLEFSVSLLQEYRQALITAAVTGQLDIGEAA